MLAEAEDFPHLLQALDQVVRKRGGTALRWRFDRMATVCHPPSGRVLPAFAAVAKYYPLTELLVEFPQVSDPLPETSLILP
ncbi:hypothetical protein [Streptomyces sp. NPDC127033]|uniref:hypothetical protein n=1 Tax=Streptomyces sp. NPDC127033 TaxID=3347110 RepID=UPI003655A40A